MSIWSAVYGSAWSANVWRSPWGGALSQAIANLLKISGSKGIETGTGPLLDGRTGSTTIINSDDQLQTLPAGMLAYEGGRLVRNLIVDGDLASAGWNKSNISVDAAVGDAHKITTAGAGTESFVSRFNIVPGIAVGEIVVCRMQLSANAGEYNGQLLLEMQENGTGFPTSQRLIVNLSSAKQTYALTRTITAANTTQVSVRLRKSAAQVGGIFYAGQVLINTNNSNVIPEYVDPLTMYNAGVPGARVFDTENANTVDANGVVTEAVGAPLAVKPRIVAEPSNISHILNSANYSAGSWQKNLVNGNVTAFTSGLLMYQWQESTAAARRSIWFALSLNADSYTVWRDFKQLGPANRLIVFRDDSISNYTAVFNISTGVVTFDPSNRARIINMGNGVYRCCLNITVPATNTLYFHFAMIESGNSYFQSYAGDGVSGCYFGHTQIEQGLSSVTSPITTTSAAVTRAANNLNLPRVGNMRSDRGLFSFRFKRGYTGEPHINSLAEVLLQSTGINILTKLANSDTYRASDGTNNADLVVTGNMTDVIFELHYDQALGIMQWGALHVGSGSFAFSQVVAFNGFTFSADILRPYQTVGTRIEHVALKAYDAVPQIGSLVLGPELVVNGDFSAGSSGWSDFGANDGMTWSVANNAMTVVRAGGINDRPKNILTASLLPNKYYLFTANITGNIIFDYGVNTLILSTGISKRVVSPAIINNVLSFWNVSDNTTVVVNNISVREIISDGYENTRAWIQSNLVTELAP